MSQTDQFKYFRIEAAELIDKLTAGLLALEKRGYRAETVNELNRAAHSLKGAARLVELFDAGDLAHAMETKLAEVKKEKKARKKDVENLLKQLDEIEKSVSAALEAPVPESDSTSPEDTEAEPSPSTDEAAPAATPADTGAEGIVWVSTRILDRIGHCSSLVVELGSRARDWEKKLEEVRESLRSVKQLVGMLEAATVNEIDTSVPHQRIDSILREIGTGLSGIGSLGQQLYGLTLEARVGSIEEVSLRFEKTVRDVAGELGRLVNLKITGREILIDRLVLQKLSEPVCHLLRNAVAHGIEAPESRRQQGKPESGTVQLLFERTENHLRVTVEDDGCGLDAGLIRNAAGLGETREENHNDDNDVSGLIFQPGLSTQAQPSKIAGRGVGLDVVRNAAEQLGGTVEVQSERGMLCRFILEIPASLDVMDVFVVSVGEQDFAIPISRLVSTSIVPREEVLNIAGMDALIVDSFPVPLLSLAGIIGAPCELGDTAKYRLVIVRSGRQKFALAADNLRGKQRVAVKSLSPEFASLDALSGHATLSDGSVSFLLNLDALAERARGGSFAVTARSRKKSETRRSVLVVDDSLTSRMNEKAILEAAGYVVHVANDGPEALGLLPHVRCDLIILDYEMPEMNGLQVAERIRAMPDYANVPMIMVSSVESDDLRRQSVEVGLKDYLTKGDFDQTRFLNTVRERIDEMEEQPC